MAYPLDRVSPSSPVPTPPVKLLVLLPLGHLALVFQLLALVLQQLVVVFQLLATDYVWPIRLLGAEHQST